MLWIKFIIASLTILKLAVSYDWQPQAENYSLEESSASVESYRAVINHTRGVSVRIDRLTRYGFTLPNIENSSPSFKQEQSTQWTIENDNPTTSLLHWTSFHCTITMPNDASSPPSPWVREKGINTAHSPSLNIYIFNHKHPHNIFPKPTHHLRSNSSSSPVEPLHCLRPSRAWSTVFLRSHSLSPQASIPTASSRAKTLW